MCLVLQDKCHTIVRKLIVDDVLKEGTYVTSVENRTHSGTPGFTVQGFMAEHQGPVGVTDICDAHFWNAVEAKADHLVDVLQDPQSVRYAPDWRCLLQEAVSGFLEPGRPEDDFFVRARDGLSDSDIFCDGVSCTTPSVYVERSGLKSGDPWVTFFHNEYGGLPFYNVMLSSATAQEGVADLFPLGAGSGKKYWIFVVDDQGENIK